MKKLYEYFGLREAINTISESNERMQNVFSKLEHAKYKTKGDVNITLTHREINTILGSINIATKIGDDFVSKMKTWDEEQENSLL